MKYHVNDSAHEWVAADPPYRVEAEWHSTIYDDDGEAVAIALGADADAAIAFARRIAEALNRAEEVTP